jgi:hypothetical protein
LVFFLDRGENQSLFAIPKIRPPYFRAGTP